LDGKMSRKMKARFDGRAWLIAAVLAWLLPLGPADAADAADAADTAATRLDVVASFSILADMVREVGGDDVAVHTLVGPDGDAHEYEPRPTDARTLGAARVLVVNGLGFEAWLPRLVQAAGFKGATVVASQGVAPRMLGNVQDPHAWQSLSNGVIYVRNIAAGLSAADPAHAQDYQARAQAYAGRLQALDARVRQVFAALPAQRRRVVTTHDAFGYFGQAYGVTFISAEGLSTDAEPSAASVARIVDQVRREHVPAVFFENISNTRLLERIAQETGTRIGGTLYSDALSRPGTPGATYVGMFESNLKQFQAALAP
jgi:zinc/manganese transport system substrate-binding protein